MARILALLTALLLAPLVALHSAGTRRPNTLLILAADLGYGDVRCYYDQSNGATHDIAHKHPDVFIGQCNQWRARQPACFLQCLRDTPEGEGNMLDRTLVLWGSTHPHASHANQNYPLHLAGGNHLGFKHDRLLSFGGAKYVPLASLFVSMLNAVDMRVEWFADSTGLMTHLTT